jgi:hypothetical protein
MRRPDGTVIMDPTEATDAWELKFLSEFGGNGAVLQAGRTDPTVAFTAFVPQRSPLTATEWGNALFLKAGRLKPGKAAGDDLVPPEVIKYGEARCAMLLGEVAESCAQQGRPECWRGGYMAPVPKGHLPVTLQSARGIKLANAAPKLVGKVLRAATLPVLLQVTNGAQLGSIPGGGTSLPSAAVRAFIAQGALIAPRLRFYLRISERPSTPC